MLTYIAGFITCAAIVAFAPPKYAAMPSEFLRAAVAKVQGWLDRKAKQ